MCVSIAIYLNSLLGALDLGGKVIGALLSDLASSKRFISFTPAN